MLYGETQRDFLMTWLFLSNSTDQASVSSDNRFSNQSRSAHSPPHG